MNKDKIAQIKKTIKHRTPEIIAGLSLVVGAAAVVYINKSLKTNDALDFQLDLPQSAIKHMIETKDSLYFETEKLNLLVKITDN